MCGIIGISSNKEVVNELVDLAGKVSKHQYQPTKYRPCIFEYVYFAHPSPTINGVSVHQARQEMGSALAKKIKHLSLRIDIVVPIPDTSRISAMSIASSLGVPLAEGFTKNTNPNRVFMLPTATDRLLALQMKMNILPEVFFNKKVLLVDDSIVRGTTSKDIISLIKTAKPKAIYLASTSPAIKFPNIYGINISSKEELIASNRTTEEVQEYLGVDKLIYQELADLELCIRQFNPKIEYFESSIFDGKYITMEGLH